MGIIAGFMVPHPPMIVPDVGRGYSNSDCYGRYIHTHGDFYFFLYGIQL